VEPYHVSRMHSVHTDDRMHMQVRNCICDDANIYRNMPSREIIYDSML
jgi:hypothetical protein